MNSVENLHIDFHFSAQAPLIPRLIQPTRINLTPSPILSACLLACLMPFNMSARYFELEGKTLNYYVTSESMAWKGNFRLTPTTRLCQEVVIDDRRCFFVQNHKKRLYMCAENSNERDMWVQVLHRCIQALAMQAS